MLFLKFFLFCFLFNGFFFQHIDFNLEGNFDKLSLDYLTDLNEEIPYLELKKIKLFNINLNKNIFDDIQNDSKKSLIEETNYFKNVYFYFEYWSKFNQTSFNLWLKIDICGIRYFEKIENKKKTKILNKLNRFELVYLFQNKLQDCLKKFSVSIVLLDNEQLEKFEYYIDSFLIFKLGVYYSTLYSQSNEIIEKNLKNDYQQINEIWKNLEKTYNEFQDQLNLKPIKYECDLKNCESFSFYPKFDKEWYFFPVSFFKEKNFYLMKNNINNFCISFNTTFEEIKYFSIEFFYFITEDNYVKLKTSITDNSIISLFPSYKNKNDSSKFVSDWYKLKVNLQDLIPFQENSKIENFKLIFELITTSSLNNLAFSAFKNFEIFKIPHEDIVINDFLKSWDKNNLIDDWFLYLNNSLVKKNYDQEKFSLIFETSELNKDIKYTLISQWFILNDQVLKFKAEINNLSCNINLKIINQNLFIDDLDEINFNSNYFYEKKLNQTYFKNQTQVEEIIFDPEYEKKKVVKLKIIVTLRNEFNIFNTKLAIKNLKLGDSCENIDICNKRGTCLVETSKKYKCICNQKYHGKNCEFINNCDETANNLCKKQNNSKCIAIGNFFRCDCDKFHFWYDKNKECKPNSNCLSNNYCESQNSLCVHDIQKGSSCECNSNYEYNDDNVCEKINHCKSNSCLSTEICHSKFKKNSLTNFFCECNFKKGYIEIDSKCVHQSDLRNPFLKQYLNCSQSYIKNEESDLYECNCQEGYFINKENQCIAKEDYCFSVCSNKQLCIDRKENEPFCDCKIGFEDIGCEKDFCKIEKNQEIIKSLCGNKGCETFLKNSEYFFKCNCNKSIYSINHLNGLCQLKDICAIDSIQNQICHSRNSVCVPLIKNNELSYECICAKGFKFNEQTNKCENSCFDFNNFFVQTINRICTIDDYFFKPKLICKPGFDEEDRMCYFNEKTNKFKLEIATKIILNKEIFILFENINNEEILTIDCEKNLDKEKCTKMKKRSLDQLNELTSNFFIDTILKNKISELIKISFKSLLGDNIYNINVLKILYSKFDSLYKLEVLIETNEYSVDLEEKLFLRNCTKNCIIQPYLAFEVQNFKLTKVYLENSSFLLECFQGTKPIIYDGNKYSCVCKEGYKEIGRVPLTKNQKFFKAICEEIDECNLGLHQCELNSTYCLNLPGSYECLCVKPNFIKKTNYSCYNPCESINCKFGKCVIESDNQFGCVCDEKCQSSFIEIKFFYLIVLTIIFFVIFILLLIIFYVFIKKR